MPQPNRISLLVNNFFFIPYLVSLWFWPFLLSPLWPEINYNYILILFASSVFILLANINQRALLKNPASLGIGLFLCAVFSSVIFSDNFAISFSEVHKYTLGIMGFFIMNAASKREQKFTLKILLSSCLAVCAFSLYWGLFVTPHTLLLLSRHFFAGSSAFEYLSRGRFFAPFLTPAALGSYTILLLPLGTACYLEQMKKNNFSPKPLQSKFRSAFLFAFILLSVTNLSASQSLGAILSLLLSVLIFAGFEQKKKLPLIWILAFCLGLILISIFLSRNSGQDRLNSPVYSVQQRCYYWKQAVWSIIKNPIIGNGPGSFPFLQKCAPHNSFLQIWGESGILGFIAFIMICVKTISHKFTLPLKQNKVYNGLWIGNLAFLIHNLMESNLFFIQISIFWWLIAGLLLCPRFSENSEKEKADEV